MTAAWDATGSVSNYELPSWAEVLPTSACTAAAATARRAAGSGCVGRIAARCPGSTAVTGSHAVRVTRLPGWPHGDGIFASGGRDSRAAGGAATVTAPSRAPERSSDAGGLTTLWPCTMCGTIRVVALRSRRALTVVKLFGQLWRSSGPKKRHAGLQPANLLGREAEPKKSASARREPNLRPRRPPLQEHRLQERSCQNHGREDLFLQEQHVFGAATTWWCLSDKCCIDA